MGTLVTLAIVVVILIAGVARGLEVRRVEKAQIETRDLLKTLTKR